LIENQLSFLVSEVHFCAAVDSRSNEERVFPQPSEQEGFLRPKGLSYKPGCGRQAWNDGEKLFSNPLLKLQVQAQRGHDDWAPVAVIARIVDVLHSEGRIETAPEMGGVIRLEDIFASVIQASVTKQKSRSA